MYVVTWFSRFRRVLSKAINAILGYIFWRPLDLIHNWILTGLILRFWFGYGERPGRVIISVVVILLATWICYWQLGNFVLDQHSSSPSIGRPTWDAALYYSLISFSALGYGSWVPEPTGWAQWVGAVQPFVGVVSAVALSITLTQRLRG